MTQGCRQQPGSTNQRMDVRSNLAEPLVHHGCVTLKDSEAYVILFQRSVIFKKQCPKIKSNKDRMPFIIHASLKILKGMKIYGS